MAGRGRGKTMSFNVEMLGLGRGESLPSQQPRPLFPPQLFKPVALKEGEDYEYMLALKQEFRGAAKKSQFYLNYSEKKRDVERYSDKYQQAQLDSEEKWEPDWRIFPAELKPTKRRKPFGKKIKPNLKKVKVTEKDKEDIVKKLEVLEKTGDKVDEKDEEEDKDEEGKKKDGDDEDEDVVDGEEVLDDEQLEEETDYAQSYFDNGEDFGEDDGDEDEGPVY